MAASAEHSAPINAPPPKLQISGYGMLGDRELKKLLHTLEQGKEKRVYYDANFLEDAALILLSRMNRDGHLRAAVSANVVLTNGTQKTFSWDGHIREPLPRPIAAREVHFTVHPGMLFHFDQIQFTGLNLLSEDDAKQFFIETGALIPLKSARVYTPQRLRAGLDSLTETLARKGYESAAAKVTRLEQNDDTGAVKVQIAVTEGKSRVRLKPGTILDRTETEAGRHRLAQLGIFDSRLAPWCGRRFENRLHPPAESLAGKPALHALFSS